ncbi:protein OCTOPUS-like [Nicotiana tabacum]|uniref:Protein OCTOPUS-like n=1 Tax=Nicotiana tabacum TaxID=4097 RepID=A0A1S3XG25_TOBAC
MTRTASQNRTRTRTRRLSACYRHPSEPVTGICAACLRERLSGLDPETSIIPTFLHSLEKPDANIGPEPEPGLYSPDLRRCRSVSTARCEGSSSYSEPRRRSCDDRSSRNTLENLFGVDDVAGGSHASFNVESKNLGLTNLSDNVCKSIVEHKNSEEIRIRADIEEDTEDGELKTMKEFIDLEFHTKINKSRDLKDIAGNFREKASVFSKKLQKWRQKQREKKLNSSRNGKLIGYKLKDNGSEIGECAIGRRSCDIEPRFSVDAGQLEGPRISIDEPRASWDGYMVARTIPRLTPMLSVVENVLLGGTGNGFDKHRSSLDGQMQAIVEDESSSSGGSGQSNSDSSSSQRGGSSFDRSSSVRSFGKKTMDLEVNEGKCMANSSPAHVKLVFTERELKDWHLNSINNEHLAKFESFSKNGIVAESCGTNKGFKKSTRWREVFNLFGNKHKVNNKRETRKGEGETFSSVTDINEKQVDKGYDDVKEAAQWRLTRSSSIIGARKSCSSSYVPARNSCSSTFDQPRSSLDLTELNRSKKKVAESAASTNFGRGAFVLERNKSVKCSSNDIDNGTLPFYLMPLRSSRRCKSSENKLTKPLYATGNVLH